MTWLLSLPGRIKGALVALLGVVVAFVGVYLAGKREGRQRAAQKAAEETIDRVEKGNDQVNRNRGGDPSKRMSDNDRRWMR